MAKKKSPPKFEVTTKKQRVDKVIERRTREEFATYYSPGRRIADRKLITVATAAGTLGVTERRVRSFITSGRLPAVKLNTLYLIKWSDLMFFKKKPRISGAPRESIWDTPDAEKTKTTGQ